MAAKWPRTHGGHGGSVAGEVGAKKQNTPTLTDGEVDEDNESDTFSSSDSSDLEGRYGYLRKIEDMSVNN